MSPNRNPSPKPIPEPSPNTNPNHGPSLSFTYRSFKHSNRRYHKIGHDTYVNTSSYYITMPLLHSL